MLWGMRPCIGFVLTLGFVQNLEHTADGVAWKYCGEDCKSVWLNMLERTQNTMLHVASGSS
jgi:hypothetical protein